MDCKIRSYNAVRAKLFGKKTTFIQKLILLRSYPYVHNEFQFSQRYDNISFSATLQDGSKGARFRQINYSHARDRWDTVTVLLSDEAEDRAYNRAKGLDGTPYDLIGQLSHATPLKIWRPSKKKIWCSKAVAECLYAAIPKFERLVGFYGLKDELRPDQLDMMARYYFTE